MHSTSVTWTVIYFYENQCTQLREFLSFSIEFTLETGADFWLMAIASFRQKCSTCETEIKLYCAPSVSLSDLKINKLDFCSLFSRSPETKQKKISRHTLICARERVSHVFCVRNNSKTRPQFDWDVESHSLVSAFSVIPFGFRCFDKSFMTILRLESTSLLDARLIYGS